MHPVYYNEVKAKGFASTKKESIMTTQRIEETISKASEISYQKHEDVLVKKGGVNRADALQFVLGYGFTITCLHDYAITAHKDNKVYSWSWEPEGSPSNQEDHSKGKVHLLTYKNPQQAFEQDCKSAAYYRGEYIKGLIF